MMDEKAFGLDYERAKRIVKDYGDGDPAKAADLAEGIREARDRGLIDPTPEQRAAMTIVANRVLRRARGWPIPNAGSKPKDE